jgi:Mn-dependent DtxR family transcriptional regulator
MENHEVAEELATLLQDNPAATVQELAEEIGVTEAQVTEVLDSHHPEDGYVGEGKGGGWITDEQRAQIVTEVESL